MADRISSGLAYFKRRFSSTENIENETEMEAPSVGGSEVKRTTSGLSNASLTATSGEDYCNKCCLDHFNTQVHHRPVMLLQPPPNNPQRRPSTRASRHPYQIVSRLALGQLQFP